MEDKKTTEEIVEAAGSESLEAQASEAAEEAVNEVAETAEEAVETVNEASETAEEAVETAAEDVKEAEASAEEATEETVEAAEKEAAEAVEAAEEAAEETAEAVKEEVGAAKAETENKEKGSPVKEPPIIKKKKKLDKTNIIVIAVCAVIVIACLVFVGFKSGWFKVKDHGKITVGDYSRIEVLNSAVEVTDEMVDQYIDSILQSQSVTEEETEGVVEEGDTVNIDYVGTLKETGEAFDGGTATGYSLTVGSGTMIPGFEDGIIGAEIGSTITVDVTFPDEYANNPDLAGAEASFTITINSRSVTVVPELTDEFVKNYSANYLETQLNTVEELKAYVYDFIYTNYLHNAMFEDLQTKATVESYPEEEEAMLVQYSLESLDYYASMYGTTAAEYAAMYGFASAEEYALDEAHYYLDTIMLVDKIIKDKHVTWTDEQLDQSIALYMSRNGYSETYTLEEFKERSGETWLYLYTNLEFKFNLAMEALEDNVVFVDEKTEPETESTEAASDAAADEETTAAE